MELHQIALIIGLCVFLAMQWALLSVLSPWLKCFSCGCPVKILNLLKLKVQRLPIQVLVDSYIIAFKTEVPVTFGEIVEKYKENPKDFQLYMKTLVEITEDERDIQPVAGGDATRWRS